MTAPVWMAEPPEVHAALLSSGPGAGPLLAAAGAWNALSAEYAAVAGDVDALLAAVQAGAWQGPSAESYVAAHAPHAAWLLQAAADSAATASQHEIAAAAYVAALATMPTLAELAANHAAHGVLVTTNFFGINTIPIALNEADYVRMWIQAATAMSTYQAVADAALASTPHVAPAPQILKTQAPTQNPLQGLLDALQPILKSLGIEDSVTAHDPMVSNALTKIVADLLQNVGVNWNPAAGTLNGQVYDYYSNAAQPIWYLARSLELFEDVLYMAQDPGQAVRALQYLAALALFDWPTHIAQFATTVSQSPALVAAAMGVALAPAASAGGLAGLAGLTGLAGLADLPQSAVLPAAALVAPGGWPAAGMGATVTAPATAPASASAPTTPTSTVAGSAPPPTPPTTGGAGLALPYAVGPPGIGFGSGMRTGATSSARSTTPAPDSAAAAAAARASARARTRRRQRAALLGDGRKFMDMDVEVAPDWGGPVASGQGAGQVGFAGTASKQPAPAAGLTTLAGDSFGGAPRTPMVPGT